MNKTNVISKCGVYNASSVEEYKILDINSSNLKEEWNKWIEKYPKAVWCTKYNTQSNFLFSSPPRQLTSRTSRKDILITVLPPYLPKPAKRATNKVVV